MKAQKDNNSRKSGSNFGKENSAGPLKEAFDKAVGRKTHITLII